MKRGSGWADWETFFQAFAPVIEQFLLAHHRLPKRSEMAGTHQYLLSAADRHHGSYTACLCRAGFTPEPYPRPKSPQENWRDRAVQLACLRHDFRTWTAWGIMPSPNTVRSIRPGLANFWLKPPSTWQAVARTFNLDLASVGETRRRTAMAIAETLDFYERHGRYPLISECRPILRQRRFRRKTSWPTFLTQVDFHPRTIEHLLARWKAHYLWCHLHDGIRIPEIQRTINALHIKKSLLEPFGRSSP